MEYNILSKKIRNILVLILTIFCFFRIKYFAALHAYMFLLIFILYFIINITKIEFKISFFTIYSIIYFSLNSLIFYFFSSKEIEESLLEYVIYFIFPVLYYNTVIELASNMKQKDILKYINFINNILIIFLIFELIIRIKNVIFTFNNEGVIKSYLQLKRNSFVFSDTNFLALFIQNILYLNLYLYKKFRDIIYKKYSICYIVFILLTFSRSVIITTFIIYYLYNIMNMLKSKKYILFILFNMFSVCLLFILYNILSNDNSLQSKIEIIKGLEYYKNVNIENQLFGFGFKKGEYIYSYIKGGYAHLHIALLLGQIGVIGLALYIIYIIVLYYKTKRKSKYLLIAFFISGFSLAFFDSSFYYVLAIISVLENKNIKGF